jgi:GMP synthase-like glutamine amidotransferase
MPVDNPFRVAVIDLYNGHPNEGMRCIRQLLTREYEFLHGRPIEIEEYDTRGRAEIPDLSFDLYISTGGPGSPYDGEGRVWETRYFNWLTDLWLHNQSHPDQPRYGLFICHSFELMCRHFELAAVTRRKSASFGVFPVHKTNAGSNDGLLDGLPDPFYAADFRAWQVVQPDTKRMAKLGATILAVEKERPQVRLERAVMGIRVSDHVVGVQFHPEADPEGMAVHFQRPERRAQIVSEYGLDKYHRIVSRLTDPNFLRRTYECVIPNFFRDAVGGRQALRPAGQSPRKSNAGRTLDVA